MTARTSRVLRWAIRLLVAAACYAAVNMVWINNGVGWDRLNFFVAAFAFGIILLPAWCVSIAVEHFYVPNTWLRLIVHPVTVTILFVAFSAVVLTQFFGDPLETLWKEIHAFAFLAMVCALLDEAVDVLLAGKLTPAPQIAS
jgi:hypothetical protein